MIGRHTQKNTFVGYYNVYFMYNFLIISYILEKFTKTTILTQTLNIQTMFVTYKYTNDAEVRIKHYIITFASK